MSLRQQLKAIVAPVSPLAMKHATFAQYGATDNATGVQHPVGNPHEHWVPDATSYATGVQRLGCISAPEGDQLRVSFANTGNTQLGLTAQRQVRELIDAAMRACDHHGDSQAAREQMLADVEATPPELRADLRDYFEKAYLRKDQR